MNAELDSRLVIVHTLFHTGNGRERRRLRSSNNIRDSAISKRSSLLNPREHRRGGRLAYSQ